MTNRMTEHQKCFSMMSGPLSNKTLLILGGNALSCDIVETAKSMGVRTIVTDWHDNVRLSPAKVIANEQWLLSVADVHTIADKVRHGAADGVLTGFVDSLLPYYVDICELAHKPCYLNRSLVEIVTDKRLFKNACRAHSVPVLREYSQRGFLEKAHMAFPVLVKPADNSGGRGITIATNTEELVCGYNRAMQLSAKKDVIVEDYVQKAEHFTACFVAREGEYVLTSMYDRLMSWAHQGDPAKCIGSWHPSRHIDLFKSTVEAQFKHLMADLGLRNGVAHIQGLVANQQVYVYDPIFRMPGDQYYSVTERMTGTNPLKMLIHYSLTGSMWVHHPDILPEEAVTDGRGFNLCLYSMPGTIGRIEGLEEVRRREAVLGIVQYVAPNDVRLAEDRRPSFKIKMFCETRDELVAEIFYILNKMHIYSVDGDDMVCRDGYAEVLSSVE